MTRHPASWWDWVSLAIAITLGWLMLWAGWWAAHILTGIPGG